jgi:transketolase
MTTVLAVYNSEGCVGRCDANCHQARSADCDCICGGKNHGKGLQQAIANNHELIGLTPEDLQRFAEAHGYKCEELKVYDTVQTPTRKIAKQRKREQKNAAWAARQKAWAEKFPGESW